VNNKISQGKICARVIFNFLAKDFKTLGEAGFLPRKGEGRPGGQQFGENTGCVFAYCVIHKN